MLRAKIRSRKPGANSAAMASLVDKDILSCKMAIKIAIKEAAVSKQYSIAEARHNLAALVHELERKAFIELTRRGEPVAVLLSIREFRRLTANRGKFWEAYEAFRKAVDLPKLNIQPALFDGLRDSSPGREVRL